NVTKASGGKPIHLSEITITAPDNTPAGQMVQAIIMRNCYRAWFSVEKMNGITWWNVVDNCGAPGEPSISGLFTRDMRPKAAYFAMDDLINREWRTKCEVKVEGEGEQRKISFRGFRGRYRLSWTDADGRGRTRLVDVE
ncbi:MAG: 1,4-beta-xylanase, partial [Kiritimatiellae bacterium]|nr:1,4-beta-xylanase [Kiritimatiellia bacterium]